MATTAMAILAGTQLVGTANEAGAIPKYDANGNLPTSSLVAASTLAGFDANGNIIVNTVRVTPTNTATTGANAGTMTAKAGGVFVFTGNAAATWFLPAISNATSCHFTIGNAGTNVLTISPNGADLLNGSTNTTTAVPTNTANSLSAGIKTFRDVGNTNIGWAMS